MKMFLKIIFIMLILSKAQAGFVGGYVGAGLGFSDLQVKDAVGYDPNDGGSFSAVQRVGMVFGNTLGLGFNISSWGKNQDSLTSYAYPLLLEANWHFVMDNNGPYIGANFGSVLVSSNDDSLGYTITASETYGAKGGQLGWNIGLGSMHSIGFEARYITVDDKGDKFDIISGYIIYNFWFGNRDSAYGSF